MTTDLRKIRGLVNIIRANPFITSIELKDNNITITANPQLTPPKIQIAPPTPQTDPPKQEPLSIEDLKTDFPNSNPIDEFRKTVQSQFGVL